MSLHTEGRALVVESDVLLCHKIARALDEAGYQVQVVGTGHEGLAVALAWEPDHVLIDGALPGLSGFEVTERLRQQGTESCVLLLVDGDERDVVSGLRHGADDCLLKPFGVAHLLARLEAVRRRSAHGKDAWKVHLGPTTIDFGAYRVTREGVEVAVTALEMRMLRFFAEHEGQMLTRPRIRDAIWGDDRSGTIRSVDNYVWRLRGKIEPEPDRPVFLVTVRGAGYRFSRPIAV